jgi:hypothetical protein
MDISSSTISGNAAGPSGGNGGGIHNSFELTISNSLITGNSTTGGGNGGGIYNNDDVTITNSVISGNTTAGGGNGGGFYDNGFDGTLIGSTVSGNTAGGGDAGGVYANGITTTITNSTISGNTAGSIGGVVGNGIDVFINNTTIASNTGGGVQLTGISMTLKNTIVANNGTACSGTSPITDGGTNLQFPGTTCPGIPSADPLLLPLANNGGPTETQALSPGSPAIDAGTTGCPPTPATDQRGVSRPQGPRCDIGSFELQSGAPPPPPPQRNAVIPTLDRWGLISLAMLLAVAARWGIRRRER